jgi:hypothetical protein
LKLKGSGGRTGHADNKSTTQAEYKYFMYFTLIDQNYEIKVIMRKIIKENMIYINQMHIPMRQGSGGSL